MSVIGNAEAVAGLLLPWHAAGTLSPKQGLAIDSLLERGGALADAFVAINRERSGLVAIHEALGAPSPRAFAVLSAAIDREAARGKSRPEH